MFAVGGVQDVLVGEYLSGVAKMHLSFGEAPRS